MIDYTIGEIVLVYLGPTAKYIKATILEIIITPNTGNLYTVDLAYGGIIHLYEKDVIKLTRLSTILYL